MLTKHGRVIHSLVAEAVSKTPSPEDDEGQTVIENDLYCH